MKIGKVYHRKLIFFDHCNFFQTNLHTEKAVLFVVTKHLFTTLREPKTANIADTELSRFGTSL
jgi:hypothetical protein